MHPRALLSLWAVSFCLLLSFPSEGAKRFPLLNGLMNLGRSCPPGGCPGTPGTCGPNGCPQGRSPGAPQALPFAPPVTTAPGANSRFVPGEGGSPLKVSPQLTWSDGSETVRMNFSTGELFFIDRRTGQRRPLHANQLKQVLANYQGWKTNPPPHVTAALKLYQPEMEKWKMVAAAPAPATGAPAPKLVETPVDHKTKAKLASNREEAPPKTPYEEAQVEYRKGRSSFKGLKSLDAHSLTCTNPDGETAVYTLNLKYDRGIKLSMVPEGTEPAWQLVDSGNQDDDPWIVRTTPPTVGEADDDPGSPGVGIALRRTGKTLRAKLSDGKNIHYCVSTPAPVPEKVATQPKPKAEPKASGPSKFAALTESDWSGTQPLAADTKWSDYPETQFTCSTPSQEGKTFSYKIELNPQGVRWTEESSLPKEGKRGKLTYDPDSGSYTASHPAGGSSIEIKRLGRKLAAVIHRGDSMDEDLYCAQNVEDDQTAAKQDTTPSTEPKLEAPANNPPKITVPKSSAPQRTGLKTINSVAEFNTALEQDTGDVVLVKFGADWCGPCKDLARSIAQLNGKPLAVEQDGSPIHVNIYDVDIDRTPQLKYLKSSSTIPEMVFLRRGPDGKMQRMDSIVGVPRTVYEYGVKLGEVRAR